jgi:2',3'-cyclic-nucleotide 2'-phosphodiesterase (5'-nucleotidase family)
MRVLRGRWVIMLAMMSLGLAACRPADPNLELTGRETRPESPLGSTLNAPTPAPSPLLILHTNDTWGYYDPCG